MPLFPCPPVLQSSALEEGMAAAFLHHNYPSFFGSIDDMADAASTLSDSAVLLGAQRLRPWQTQLLPYIGSLASRSVVTHNREPAPSRFSQISKPQIFAIERTVMERRQQAVAAFHPHTSGTTAAPQEAAALQGGYQARNVTLAESHRFLTCLPSYRLVPAVGRDAAHASALPRSCWAKGCTAFVSNAIASPD